MTIEDIKKVIKHYNETHDSNHEKLKGFSNMKKLEMIEFMDIHIADKEKKELCSFFEPKTSKNLLEKALSLISGEYNVEKLHQAALINGGRGYKIWFKGKYGMHETTVEVVDSEINRSCDCRFSKSGGICIHQMAILLMLISKKIISLENIPFNVDEEWFESIQKRLDLIATQSLFKEEPAIMLSNGYKIFINGDLVTYEWYGDFPGKKTRDLSQVEDDVDSWICNKVVDVMLKHVKVKTREGKLETIEIDSYGIVDKIMEREKLVNKLIKKLSALEDPSLPSNKDELLDFLKSDLKDSVFEIKIQPPFKAYQGESPFLFVSYAHKDKAQVYPIIKRLHKNGINIWYDEGIPLTTDWGNFLGQKIIDCDLFLSFISTNVNDSDNTQKEIKYACLKKKPYISIHLEKTDLSPGLEMILQDIQGIMKYNMNEEKFYDKLVSEIIYLLPK